MSVVLKCDKCGDICTEGFEVTTRAEGPYLFRGHGCLGCLPVVVNDAMERLYDEVTSRESAPRPIDLEVRVKRWIGVP